jgi:hypothetical protein
MPQYDCRYRLDGKTTAADGVKLRGCWRLLAALVSGIRPKLVRESVNYTLHCMGNATVRHFYLTRFQALNLRCTFCVTMHKTESHGSADLQLTCVCSAMHLLRLGMALSGRSHAIRQTCSDCHDIQVIFVTCAEACGIPTAVHTALLLQYISRSVGSEACNVKNY